MRVTRSLLHLLQLSAITGLAWNQNRNSGLYDGSVCEFMVPIEPGYPAEYRRVPFGSYSSSARSWRAFSTAYPFVSLLK